MIDERIGGLGMSNQQVDLLIEYLKQKQFITDLEKDIIDTWHELKKVPFDRQGAEKKIKENILKYRDIFIIIRTTPGTINKPFAQATDEEMEGNLFRQLELLCIKEVEG